MPPSSTRGKSPKRQSGGPTAAARGKSPKRGERDRTPKRQRRREDQPDDRAVPEKLARKIIQQAEEQRQEMAEEERERRATSAMQQPRGNAADLRDADFDEDGNDDDGDGDGSSDGELEQARRGDYFEEVEELELDADDTRALEMLMGAEQPRCLADIIMEKIAAHTEAGGVSGTAPEGSMADMPMPALPAKVIEVYRNVGKLMKTYRSGKLPKAFKIVPRLTNWEEVVYITCPEDWSAAATREATKLFASNMNARMAQRFFNLVLLPAVQQDIRDNHKLNFHLYLALKKALYKPAAFFKGVLLPLAEGRGATLREALIICSVLSKVSIPMLHSAVAILKLSQMSFSGANALFLRTLLLKKYALPYRVIDALVEYFLSFRNVEHVPTLLWQQSLLSFAQHYKTEVSAEQKTALRDLLRVTAHPKVTPEIRRELFTSRSRGDPFLAHLAGGEHVTFADESMGEA